jgi:biopolymer transport protein TolR
MPQLASRGRGRRTINEINMVPFIDVMLVLLIIFMVTAPLITPSVVDLPSVGKASRKPDAVIEVIIKRDESLQVSSAGNNRQTTVRAVAEQVRAMQAGNANTAVIISADRQVKYELVVRVMDNLQRAGVQRVGLSVQTGP